MIPNHLHGGDNLVFTIDFDGTVVTHKYPDIGKVVPHAMETMQQILDAGHKIILYTMRSGEKLQEAVSFLEGHNIELYGINKNPTQSVWTKSPKVYGHIYIGDDALGCPLTRHPEENELGRMCVDWVIVNEYLSNSGIINP